MAYADYYHCDICDSKAFYDAQIDWDETRIGDMKVICKKCAESHDVVVMQKVSLEYPLNKIALEKAHELRKKIFFESNGELEASTREIIENYIKSLNEQIKEQKP